MVPVTTYTDPLNSLNSTEFYGGPIREISPMDTQTGNEHC